MDNKIEGYRERLRREKTKVRVRTEDSLNTSRTVPATELKGEPVAEQPEEIAPQTEIKEIGLEELIDRLKKHVTRVATSAHQAYQFNQLLNRADDQLLRTSPEDYKVQRRTEDSVEGLNKYNSMSWKEYWKLRLEVCTNPYVFMVKGFFGGKEKEEDYRNNGVLRVLIVDEDHIQDGMVTNIQRNYLMMRDFQRPQTPSVTMFGRIAFDRVNSFTGTPCIKLDFEDSPKATETRKALIELLKTAPAEVFRRIWSDVCGLPVTTRDQYMHLLFSLLDEHAAHEYSHAKIRKVIMNKEFPKNEDTTDTYDISYE